MFHLVTVLRFSLLFLGALIMLAGVVITPLPGPFGVPIILFGLVLALRSSSWAKRQFLRLVRRYPQFLSPLRKMLRPRARIVSILYRQMLKIERFILPKSLRRLQLTRRIFRRKRRPFPAKA
jgi:hypothetical protein